MEIAGKVASVSLVFEIAEGARTGVGEIDFVGNKAFSASRLKDVIKTGQTNILSFLLDNDLYDPDRVEGDRDLLQRFYRAHGFADAVVKSAAARYDEAQKRLVLTFAVDEGPQYRFGTVKLDSEQQGIDAARLLPLLLTRAGGEYNADKIDKTVEALSLELARQQHPFSAVHVEPARNLTAHTVDLVYRIEQGPPLYVERIEIHGNSKTRDYVIRRELALTEGDAFNKSLIEVSERRLRKLGHFKSVKFSRKPGSAPDRAVLDVTVEEQETGNFSIAGGYSDTGGWMAQVGVGDTNFFGNGQTAKVSVTYGQFTRSADVAFIEPYLFGQNVSLALDLFGSQTSSSSYQSYNSTTYGTSLTFGTPLNDELALAWRYSIKNQSLTLDPAQVSSLPVQEAAAAGPQWVSAVGSGITYNTLDDNKHPRDGVLLTTNNDVAGLGGGVKFLRNTEDVRYYKSFGDVTGIARVQGGYITPWGGQTLPLIDGFFGGPQLVRGFATNGFGPRVLTPGATQDNVGGNAYWATSYELQTPMPYLPQSFGLKAAVFADAGSLWRTSAAGSSPALSASLIGNAQTVRSSLGAGLVWDSILGPLRVDYAYPISKASYDVTQRVHFGYGLF
jgi:outer membrane protein insertion porin family